MRVVRARLERRLYPVGSIWFPTVGELQGWPGAEAPLYLRRLSGDRLEIGVRSHSLYAARFCPVLRGQLQDLGDRTRIDVAPTLDRFTLVVVIGLGAVLAVWAAVLAMGLGTGQTRPAAIGFWALLLLALVGGLGVGWRQGGDALEERLPWLRRAAEEPLDEAEG